MTNYASLGGDDSGAPVLKSFSFGTWTGVGIHHGRVTISGNSYAAYSADIAIDTDMEHLYGPADFDLYRSLDWTY